MKHGTKYSALSKDKTNGASLKMHLLLHGFMPNTGTTTKQTYTVVLLAFWTEIVSNLYICINTSQSLLHMNTKFFLKILTVLPLTNHVEYVT